MMIFDTHQRIDALKKIMPGGFIFVLDTTDRSFIYKSQSSSICEEYVISLDKESGIDSLTKSKKFYSHEDDHATIKLEKMAKNTYLGLCVSKGSYSQSQLSKVESYFRYLEPEVA